MFLWRKYPTIFVWCKYSGANIFQSLCFDWNYLFNPLEFIIFWNFYVTMAKFRFFSFNIEKHLLNARKIWWFLLFNDRSVDYLICHFHSLSDCQWVEISTDFFFAKSLKSVDIWIWSNILCGNSRVIRIPSNKRQTKATAQWDIVSIVQF